MHIQILTAHSGRIELNNLFTHDITGQSRDEISRDMYKTVLNIKELILK